MKYYAVDFESYYDKVYSIKTMGVDAYINDPQFDAYLVSVYGEDISFVGHPSEFDWNLLNGHQVLAHNARFDETVALKLIKEKVIPATFSPAEWLCTADLSVYLQAPRNLAGAARHLCDIRMNKETRDKMAKLTYKEACDLGMKQEVDDYTLGDAVACYEIFSQHGHKWSGLERMISKINREESRRGVAVDTKRLDEYHELLTQTLWKAGNRIPWDWSDRKTPLSPKMLRLECRKAGIPCPTSLAKDSEECMLWENEYGKDYPWVAAMRDWRRANMMLKKVVTLRNRTVDGIFPYSIKYFGGHTGRFSGGGGFNMQNLPRGMNMGVDLRSLFIPRKGKKMVVADLSQIEARVLLWLADDMVTLDEIRGGHSVYEAHAISTMRYDASRGPLDEVDPNLYKLAKARVLGLGFGCGAARFKDVARVMAGIELTDEECLSAVTDFRNSNPKIVNMWQCLQRDCTYNAGGTFSVELPSGRMMNYYNVRRDRGELTAEMEIGGGRRVKVYGGKLAENITQATARDVFTERMPVLKEMGCDQLFHVHDEYVLEVDFDVTEDAIEEAIIVTPDWLEDCPLGAKVNTIDRYQK